MTKKQIDLYQKVTDVLGNAEMKDVITALSCIVSSTVSECMDSKTHGYYIQNLIIRQTEYFRSTIKKGKMPLMEDVPKF